MKLISIVCIMHTCQTDIRSESFKETLTLFFMEVEYTGRGVLISPILFLYINLNTLGVCATIKLSRGSLIRVSSLAAALMARQYRANRVCA